MADEQILHLERYVAPLKQTLARAQKFADEQKHAYVTVQHVLLCLLEAGYGHEPCKRADVDPHALLAKARAATDQIAGDAPTPSCLETELLDTMDRAEAIMLDLHRDSVDIQCMYVALGERKHVPAMVGVGAWSNDERTGKSKIEARTGSPATVSLEQPSRLTSKTLREFAEEVSAAARAHDWNAALAAAAAARALTSTSLADEETDWNEVYEYQDHGYAAAAQAIAADCGDIAPLMFLISSDPLDNALRALSDGDFELLLALRHHFGGNMPGERELGTSVAQIATKHLRRANRGALAVIAYRIGASLEETLRWAKSKRLPNNINFCDAMLIRACLPRRHGANAEIFQNLIATAPSSAEPYLEDVYGEIFECAEIVFARGSSDFFVVERLLRGYVASGTHGKTQAVLDEATRRKPGRRAMYEKSATNAADDLHSLANERHLLPLAFERSLLHVGDFTCESSGLIVIDPCYQGEAELSLTVWGITPGTWAVQVWRQTDEFGTLNGGMLACSKDLVVLPWERRWEPAKSVGVDSAQLGLFDVATYRTGTETEQLEWYDTCCARTYDGAGGLVTGGCVVTAGRGDGFYDVYIARGRNMEICAVYVDFRD